LYIVANHCDAGDIWTSAASIQHSVIFHTNMEGLKFGPSQQSSSPLDSSSGKWFCKEDWMSRMNGGRVVFNSRVWTADGTHAATAMQDGMLRLTKKAKITPEEEHRIRQVESQWKRAGKL